MDDKFLNYRLKARILEPQPKPVITSVDPIKELILAYALAVSILDKKKK